MNCKRADKLLIDSLMGTLSREARQDLDAHLTSCTRCSEEAASMESLWHELGDLGEEPLEVPSERLTRRFRLALADLESVPEASSLPSFSDWWASLWTVRPAWQAALSAVLLLMGVLLGAGLAGQRRSSDEIDQLRAEVETMSRAVTVSLLHHQSASERLRAVSWSRMAGGDEQVLTALLDSARTDPNVNVRLAAVDALAGYADQGTVRARLIDTLELEKSPLVQLAVLEAVAGEEGLRNGELQRLKDASEVDPTLLEYFTNQAESL
jgi:anti-sigma factor RsiW